MGQTAEELLNSLTEEQIAAYTADPANEEHIVVGADRFITVPPSLKRIAVQFDHDIETVTFDCPRYWDGHDMSKMAIYINYMRQDSARGSYAATNVTVDETDETMMHFDWTISGNVTEVKGVLSFLICVKKTVNGESVNHWNSELNREMTVSEGLECSESIFELYPDLITQLLLKMDELGKLLVISDDGNGNVNIEGLNTTLNIAETFSDKATYAEGDYAIFYGTLYKCVRPVTVPDMWRAANWKEVNIVDELKECFQYVSDGKTLIASAIIDMGVQTGATDTFSKMANNIRSIKTGVAASGTAEVSDVTSGKTFINKTGKLLTGTSTAAADLTKLQGQYDTLVVEKSTLQLQYNTVVSDKNALQKQYNTVVAEKSTLQGQYNTAVTEKNNVQTAYNNYKNAVVNGLANSGLGVTTSTTASELQAILLAQYPAYTPYEVRFADYPVSLSNCAYRRENNINEQFTNENGSSFYLQVEDGDSGGSYGQLGGSVSLQTKGCNKVDITYETVGTETFIGSTAINPNTSKNGTLTFDCSGSTFNLYLQVTASNPGIKAYVRISKIRFYYV